MTKRRRNGEEEGVEKRKEMKTTEREARFAEIGQGRGLSREMTEKDRPAGNQSGWMDVGLT